MKNSYSVIKYIDLNEDIEQFIFENGTVFHQFKFLEAVGEDYLCYTIKEKQSDNIVAVFPLVKSNKFGLKSYHIPPLTYQFGPVFNKKEKYDNMELFNLFFNELDREAQLDFKFFIEDQGIYNYRNLNFSVEANQTYIIERDSDFSISKIHNSKRRYLKKLIILLEKGEIKIVKGKDCLSDLLEIYKRNSNEVGFSSNSDYLKNLMKNLNDNRYYAHVLYSNQGEALSGAFCPYDKYTAYYLINASIKNPDKLLNRTNFLSTYLAIDKARELNLNFDFEGSNIIGIANYYQMMGGEAKINYRIQKTRSLYYILLKGLKKIKIVNS